ncbi:DDE-type integrase/transposase/recombinase [Roseomonas sp. GCM10028921]
MLGEHRDMAAEKAFFRSARSATGMVPDQVTTDGHGSYPRAIRSTLGKQVEHRSSALKNNRLEQDHRGIAGEASDVCAGSRASAQRSASVTATLNSATTSALVSVTTSMFQPAAVARSIVVV